MSEAPRCPTCGRVASERWGAECGSITHDGITHPSGPIFAVGPCTDRFHDLGDWGPEILNAAAAYKQLCACYRIGRNPSEKLWKELESADALLEELAGEKEGGKG